MLGMPEMCVMETSYLRSTALLANCGLLTPRWHRVAQTIQKATTHLSILTLLKGINLTKQGLEARTLLSFASPQCAGLGRRCLYSVLITEIRLHFRPCRAALRPSGCVSDQQSDKLEDGNAKRCKATI